MNIMLGESMKGLLNLEITIGPEMKDQATRYPTAQVLKNMLES
jgi:hypothetical protein